MTIRVLVVDDDALTRSAIRMVLAGTDDIELVAEAGDGSEVPAVMHAHAPDVVLMDIRMPGTDGLTATESLRRLPNPPKVIILTTFDADEHVLRALRAGADGFLLKDTRPALLVESIRSVVTGDVILSPAITRKLIAHVAATTGPNSPDGRRRRAAALLTRLTDRESQVAFAVGRGGSNAEIAAELRMSVPTVKAHVSRLLTKLDLTNRVQIALLVHDAHQT